MPADGIGYGHLRWLRDQDFGPAPQILFNYLGRFGAEGGGDWSPAAPLREGVDPANPAMPLEINAHATGDVFTATLSWPAGILGEDRVVALGEQWMAALRELAAADVSGHTPSDFPLVTLTQEDVDAFADATEVLPLLPLQEGMYFHAVTSEVDTYAVQQIAELTGEVDPARLRRAVEAAVARHDALRASFRGAARRADRAGHHGRRAGAVARGHRRRPAAPRRDRGGRAGPAVRPGPARRCCATRWSRSAPPSTG